MDDKWPQGTPGSDEAIKNGCKCPVLDNAHGKGYMCNPDVFVMFENCPIHKCEVLELLKRICNGEDV